MGARYIPEEWEIDFYANQLDLVQMSKLNMAKHNQQERKESLKAERARHTHLQERKVNSMDTGNLAVDEIYTAILRTLGRRPDTFAEFMAEAIRLVKESKLDRLWFTRLKRSLIANQSTLYPQ